MFLLQYFLIFLGLLCNYENTFQHSLESYDILRSEKYSNKNGLKFENRPSFSNLPTGFSAYESNGLLNQVRGDDEDSCMPQLADTCFSDVYTNFECRNNPTLSPQCKKRDIDDLCSGLDDSLTCCSDIIDTDCSLEGGRATFDSWLKGLRAVYSYLCDNNSKNLKALLSSKKCWNSLSFITCVEKLAGVTHIVDMLQVILDKNECNRLLIAISTCNVRATTTHEICELSQEVISEAIHSFFSQTKCGSICNNNSNKSTSTSVMLLIILVKTIKQNLLSA